MNKTITSNIAGYVFHIDENAYDKLDAYLNTIRSYFSDSQGRDEIITDIEARLAEMLHERIGDLKQVVTLEDVNHVIGVMGQPEAFMEDDPDTAEWTDRKSPRSAGAKRLFRDPDNRIVGGVCAGISSYLGINDPVWLRLALVLSVLFFGTGILLYIILWIIIPEARTTAEKLQMRGENVTVSNIEKKVNEEMEAVKQSWNGLHGNSSGGRRIGNAIHRLFSLLGNLIVMALKFIAKLIGVMFLAAGLIGFMGLLTVPLGLPTMISIGNDGVVSSMLVQDILHNLVGGTGMLIWIYITGMLVWGVPLLALAYVGARLLFNFRRRVKGVGISFILLWIIGVVMSFAVTLMVMSDFSSEGTDTQTVQLNFDSNPDQVINLALNHELGDDEPTFEAEIFDLELMASGSSSQLFGKPQLDINMAKTGGPRLIIKRKARAKHKQDALERANKINYGFMATDTSILFNGYFEIPEDELWRTQDVDLELLIPVGYTIYLSDEMMRIIYDIDNVTNTYDGNMVGRRWIMTPKGLACVDCEGLDDPGTSIGDPTGMDIDEVIDRELEEKQRALEMEQERLEREMEKRQQELERIEEDLQREREEAEAETEEASSTSPKEILLRRVINATYQVTPTLRRTINISYPG